jgi:uncharacterized membrane protein YebE (DUF533 family)
MQKIVSVILTTVFVFGLSAAVFAQSTNTPRVDRREHRQQRRIRQGVRSGELTHREASRLRRQERVTRRQEAAAKADGKVTKRERRHLNRRENRTSRHIYRQKHDNQKR